LAAIATVTDDDVEAAAQAWRENPPDDEFVNLLDAEVESD
jgi:hypothetical protein